MSNLFKISLLVMICSVFDNCESGLDQIRTSMSIKSIVYVQAKKKNKTKKKRKKAKAKIYDSISSSPHRPHDIEPGMYCLTCQRMMESVARKLAGKTSESDITEFLDIMKPKGYRGPYDSRGICNPDNLLS